MPKVYFEINVDICGQRCWIERCAQECEPVYHLNGEAVTHAYAKGKFFTTGTRGVYQFITDSDELDADGLQEFENMLLTLIDIEMENLHNFRREATQEIFRQLNIRKD